MHAHYGWAALPAAHPELHPLSVYPAIERDQRIAIERHFLWLEVDPEGSVRLRETAARGLEILSFSTS
jgi:hypothetical protein